MKKLGLILLVIFSCVLITGCELDDTNTKKDVQSTLEIGNKLANNQPTPTDIEYSLERYNLIRRTYWINGMREKAVTLPSPVTLPLGYVILFNANTIVAQFTIEGKVTSLNSYLTPDSEYYERNCGNSCTTNKWLPDVDGAYGYNDNGIFFFTTDGKYVEWNGEYLYSDIPIYVKDPIVQIK